MNQGSGVGVGDFTLYGSGRYDSWTTYPDVFYMMALAEASVAGHLFCFQSYKHGIIVHWLWSIEKLGSSSYRHKLLK
jgi:hypothetical protein